MQQQPALLESSLLTGSPCICRALIRALPLFELRDLRKQGLCLAGFRDVRIHQIRNPLGLFLLLFTVVKVTSCIRTGISCIELTHHSAQVAGEAVERS